MAVANRILMYNTKKGEIVKALKGERCNNLRTLRYDLRAGLFIGREEVRIRRVSYA